MKQNKILLFAFLILLSVTLNAQDSKDIEVKTKATESTVFMSGAQVLRKGSVDIPQGKSVLRITDLSPYIDGKSIQVRLNENVMITGISNRVSYKTEGNKKVGSESELEKQQETRRLERIDSLRTAIAIENVKTEAIDVEIDFLEKNKKLGDSFKDMTLITMKEAAKYYSDRSLTLRKEKLSINKKVADMNFDLKVLQNQNNQVNGKNSTKAEEIGEILVEVETKVAVRTNIELGYYVKGVSWTPSYEIRSTGINAPIQLIYRANVLQNTKEDWDNVKLKISSNNPSLGNVAPRQKKYVLGYNIAPPRYNDIQRSISEVSGIVLDNRSEPLIGVSVNIPGTTVGTVTDLDGRFSLTLPVNARSLNVAYIGFKPKTIPITSGSISVIMEEDQAMLDEVVVVGYSTEKKKTLTGSVSKVEVPSSLMKEKAVEIQMPVEKEEKQTSVEFDIKIPYTLKSGGKTTAVEISRSELPANYEYVCIPKADKDVFLVANIPNWQQYTLLDGEASIFFEDNYLGKTIIETEGDKKNLQISFGRDKNIKVTRESFEDRRMKKIFSGKVEERRSWKVDVVNNKNAAVNISIVDQIPVPNTSEIELIAEELSNGELNEDTGEVKWTVKLAPSAKKEFVLQYKAKYPSSYNIRLE